MQVVSKELVMERLKDVYDPEIHMSIVELGLVYDVEIEDGVIRVIHSLTTPACPLGPVISGMMQDALMDLPGIKEVEAVLTFEPPWEPKTMASEDVNMAMGIW